jgi:hypothetical protein
MSAMNWGAFDLNLLIVFDAVMQERSVTRAGNRIGLSQPAMSHALNRLRSMLEDDLFGGAAHADLDTGWNTSAMTALGTATRHLRP